MTLAMPLRRFGRMSVLVVACVAANACDAGSGSAARGAAGVGDSSKPRFVRGPTSGQPIPPFVKARLAEARAGERVIVYVGATWCEPCKHFHAAVQSGQLDGSLSGLVMIELDADRDREALAAGGYGSQLIPLFAVPDGEGRGTDRRIVGSIKGPGAAAEIAPRLKALLRGGGA